MTQSSLEAFEEVQTGAYAPTKYQNPLLEVFLLYNEYQAGWGWNPKRPRNPSGDLLLARSNSYNVRSFMTERTSWAVPTDAAIDLIASYSPLIEIGAGSGYWAWMLEQAGADILAFDFKPNKKNDWMDGETFWIKVNHGNAGTIKRYPDRTLMLCWPPMTGMASTCLDRYQGEFLIYIGEHAHGCCCDLRFFNKLERQFERIEERFLPTWPGTHDYLSIWKRL